MHMRLTVLILLAALPLGAQTLTYVPPPLLDTSAAGDDPWVQRSMGAQVIAWGSHRYLMDNIGNNLCLRLVDNPAAPGYPAQSGFAVPPFGDRDYNLFNFAVCDNCRYGLAGFQSCGTMLFDLGTAVSPMWAAKKRYASARQIGGATWRVGSDQYLLTSQLSSSCQSTGLYLWHSVSSLELLQCVGPLTVDGGVLLGDPPYLWTVGSGEVRAFRLTGGGSGAALRLEDAGTVARAGWNRAVGLSVEGSRAAVAGTTGVAVLDASDPAHPVTLSTWRTSPLNANGVALHWPWLVASALGGSAFGWVYDLSDPTYPFRVPVAWESPPYAGWVTGAWADEWLFTSRWSVLQRYHAAGVEYLFRDGFDSGNMGGWQ